MTQGVTVSPELSGPTVAAPPGPQPAPPPAGPPLGIEPGELKNLSSAWRMEAAEIGKLVWTALGEATGEGSEVLATARATADPAQQAMTSIADRFGALAGLLDRFSADVQQRDAEIAYEISILRPR